jgi:hypothetical protein
MGIRASENSYAPSIPNFLENTRGIKVKRLKIYYKEVTVKGKKYILCCGKNF